MNASDNITTENLDMYRADLVNGLKHAWLTSPTESAIIT